MPGKKNPKKRKQIDPLEQAIELVLDPGSFISYNAAWSFVHEVEEVASKIDKIVEKEPERAARLLEIFIAACHEKAEEIDDSSGSFGMLVDDLFQGWIKARQAAGADPDETARTLLAWMEDDPYGFCHDLDREAAKVLDKKGMVAFVQQIRDKFETSPTKDEKTERFPGYARRRLGWRAQDPARCPARCGGIYRALGEDDAWERGVQGHRRPVSAPETTRRGALLG
jgi:hypothetical protein